MQKTNIAEIFKILETIYPNPKTELDFVNNYTLLVAVVLSAQATDKGVNKATQSLFKVVQNPKQMLDLGLVNLQDYIKSIGLYKNKAKNIILLSEVLQKYSQHNLKNFFTTTNSFKAKDLEIVDDEVVNFLHFYNLINKQYTTEITEINEDNKEILINKLTNLAGVGRKTASVVLNVGFKLTTMPVDTHLFRLAHRWNLSKALTVEGVEKDLVRKIPKEYLPKAHHLMILFGRYTCKAKGFKCITCPINFLCPSKI